jgi:hypothetical protein
MSQKMHFEFCIQNIFENELGCQDNFDNFETPIDIRSKDEIRFKNPSAD